MGSVSHLCDLRCDAQSLRVSPFSVKCDRSRPILSKPIPTSLSALLRADPGTAYTRSTRHRSLLLTESGSSGRLRGMKRVTLFPVDVFLLH